MGEQGASSRARKPWFEGRKRVWISCWKPLQRIERALRFPPLPRFPFLSIRCYLSDSCLPRKMRQETDNVLVPVNSAPSNSWSRRILLGQ